MRKSFLLLFSKKKTFLFACYPSVGRSPTKSRDFPAKGGSLCPKCVRRRQESKKINHEEHEAHEEESEI
jgi:hypothetical protein